MTIAIIGTAGRDKRMPMPPSLWDWMCHDATTRVPAGTHLVSGGAAWADHFAVYLFLTGHAERLTLHLPAPFVNGRFVGGYGTSGGAANYYHDRFSHVISQRTLRQLADCIDHTTCDVTHEPVALGYHAMFARNRRVATADFLFAYTFGTGDIPADGGTRDTWNVCTGVRVHIPLPRL